MPKICYDTDVLRRLRNNQERMALIAQANTIIDAYQAQGFDLTLRQLYYQFVARDLIPNKDTEYKKLGAILLDARMAGLVDWDAIVDRTRNLRSLAHWDDPASIVDACASQFRIDLWAGQQYRPEVWIEKDALVGVISGVCESLDVPYFSCRGYTSVSEIWGGAMRLKKYVKAGQTPIILHFGDHDPSGIDMTRDIRDRMRTFGVPLEVRRLALNMDQVEQYEPPPNPAKMTDTRCAGYIAEYETESSWELDALEPAVLAALITTTIESLRDDDPWNEAVREQQQARDQLSSVSERWDDVVQFVGE